MDTDSSNPERGSLVPFTEPVLQSKTEQPKVATKEICKWYEPLILKAKDYDFNEPVSKSDKEFWQGVGAKTYDDYDEEIKCILHVNTNLIITYEGKLIGRQTDEGIICVEDLDTKIIQWYMNCGF